MYVPELIGLFNYIYRVNYVEVFISVKYEFKIIDYPLID
jgi:hypothetical protein